MYIMKLFLRHYKDFILSGLLVLFFAGCSGSYHGQHQMTPKISKPAEIENLLKAVTPENEIQRIIKRGLIELNIKGDFHKASTIFKEGLKLNPANGHLHFLNALSYHMMSLSGDIRMLSLAESGYLTALKFDNANYIAAYLLGHLYFEQKRFSNAQNQFAYALMYAPQNLKILRALSVATYYNGDLSLAQWSAQRAYEMDSNSSQNIRALIFSKAAAGKISEARIAFNEYKQISSTGAGNSIAHIEARTTDMVSGRIDDWKNYYAYAGNTIFDNSSDSEDILGGDETDDEIDEDDSDDYTVDDPPEKSGSSQGPKTKFPKMALIDVVILRTEEVRSQSKGINLLDGLRTTLSGTLFGYNWTKGKNSVGESLDSSSMYIAPSFNLLDLEYNLNIFNDSANKAEVLARPSLLAVEHETSKFFSGRELQVQLSSNNSDGSMVDIPIGIHLHVTPIFYGDDNIKVTIHASKTFLESLSEEVGFTAFSQMAKTSVDATAVMKFGETLILSGLTENEKENSKSGVPLLQSIPGVQYLFSRDEQSETKKSILILLTPRKARYLNDNVSIERLESSVDHNRGSYGTYTSELKKKEKIVSNIDAILFHLSKESSFYRQFRSGDLELDSWNNEDTICGAIKRVLGFMYY